MESKPKYIRTVKPTTEEKKNGAEVVFIYMYMNKKTRVFGAKCHESWEQWGAPTEVLWCNTGLIEEWRRNQETEE
jgi:hypothetical protein